MSPTAFKESLRLRSILPSRVAIASLCLLLLVTGLTLSARSAHPDITGPLPLINVEYHSNPGAPFLVSGTGMQQVFPINSRPTTGIFSFDPRLLPQTSFLQGGPGSIKDDDFVYALVVNNDNSDPLVRLTTILSSGCVATAIKDPLSLNITSIGYAPANAAFHPGRADSPTMGMIGGVDFFFENENTIPKPGNSAILFYTSPQPPAPAATSIGTTGVVAPGSVLDPVGNSIFTPIYGACPTDLSITKLIGCANNGSCTNNVRFDKTRRVTSGTQICYQITISNVGHTTLSNVKVSDNDLGGDLTSTFFPPPVQPCSDPGSNPPCLPHDETSATVTKVLGPFTASVSKTNTATIEAEYILLDQQGLPLGQTFKISKSATADLIVGNVNDCPGPKCDKICFRPPILCQIFLNKLPPGTILIGGVNNNNPINIQTNGPTIKNALLPCPAAIPNCTLSPLQQLNQQFVAAQLSLAANGGVSSPVAFNVLWSNLSCYPELASLLPAPLSNGVTLTSNSMVKDLFEQARLAIIQNRPADMVILAKLFKQLNSCNKNTL